MADECVIEKHEPNDTNLSSSKMFEDKLLDIEICRGSSFEANADETDYVMR